MKILFFTTEDKINFLLDVHNNIDCHGFPLNHGIISSGMRKEFQEKNLSMDLWYEYVSYLNSNKKTITNPLFSQIEAMAISTQTLSFAQSAFCAKEFVMQYIFDKYNVDDIDCEITSLQEGHISSIWKINIKDCAGLNLESFILNISRDYKSGTELKRISEMMKILEKRYPEIRIAHVYSVDSIKIEYYNSAIDVVVTANEYINNAKNIYYRNDDEFGSHQYYIAERFLVAENDNPGPIKNILAYEASTEINKQINKLIEVLTQSQIDGVFPAVDINRGDFVWNGKQVVVVGLS